MSGCSLQEAFPDTAKISGEKASKNERAKAKRCKGPALAFLKEIDPDRQAQTPLPPAEKLDKRKFESFAAEINTPLLNQSVNDVIGESKKYFGKGLTEDGFADFSNSLKDTAGYQIQGADFMASFGQKGADAPTAKAPAIDISWKPELPSGATTSFFPIPNSGQSETPIFTQDEKLSLISKIDTLFARLEDLESKTNEHAPTEVALFILSGLFLMFGLETVRKF
jgi:hypothetical protein